MKKYRFTPISAAITLALSTSAVMAQESTQKPTEQYILDTITIIATQDDIQETIRSPQAINTVNAAMISNTASKNIPAALRLIPNVDVLGGPTPSNENISIRGLPQSHAYISIDGIYQSNFATKRGSWQLNPSFVHNIQVTAGPTSGAAAGKIAIKTIDALQLLAKLVAGYRSNNAQQDLGLSVFGLEDRLDYLVAVQTSDRDAYEIGGIGGSYDKTRGDQQSALVKIGNQFNKDQRLAFAFNFDDSRTYQVKQDVGFRDTKYTGSSLMWTDKASDNDLIDLSAALYLNNVDSYSWEEKGDNVQGTQDNSWDYSISNNSDTELGLIHFGMSGHFTAHSVDWPDGEKVNIGQAQLKGIEITSSYALTTLTFQPVMGELVA